MLIYKFQVFFFFFFFFFCGYYYSAILFKFQKYMYMYNFIFCFSSPQYVRERLLCHAIIGRQGGKELIMKIDVTTDFISPLLEFSTKSVYFRVDKVFFLIIHLSCCIYLPYLT